MRRARSRTTRVRFSAAASDDLNAVYEYVAGAAGAVVAGGYMDRLEAACDALKTFPERGARREELGVGYRATGFERRATIVFQVLPDAVRIVRILPAGRDVERAFGRDSPEAP